MSGAQQLLPQRASRFGPQALPSRRRCRNAVQVACYSDEPSASGRSVASDRESQQAGLAQTQLGANLGGAAKLIAATAVVYHVAFSSSAARAEDRPWKPRRHHRRLGERFTDTWAEELVEEQEGFREKRQEEARLTRLRVAEQKEADQKRIRQDEEAMKRRAQEIMVKQQEAARTGGLPFKLVISGTDFAPFVVWSAILAALVAVYRSRFFQWLASGGKSVQTGGKWVYDRSLGGRKVFVPDAAAFAGPATGTSLSERADRSRMADAEFDRLSNFAAAARTGSGSPSAAAAATVDGMPAWWDSPPVLYATATTKAACEAEAGAILARLERSKISNKDYDLSEIRALRRKCQEGHVSVKPRTVGGRDAIFRAAVEAAVAAAQARNFASLDDAKPPRWVAGVAADVGMEDGRAVGIVMAVVASAVRARLLDAVTSMKSSNTDPKAFDNAVYALARIASTLEFLPVLTADAPEVELVASSLRGVSSVEERRILFYLLAQLHEESAELAARLLGFDPALIVPEQRAELAAAREQEGWGQEEQQQQQQQQAAQQAAVPVPAAAQAATETAPAAAGAVVVVDDSAESAGAGQAGEVQADGGAASGKAGGVGRGGEGRTATEA